MVEATEDRYLTHQDPLLRDRANYLLQARVPGEASTFEQLWVRRMGDGGPYEICCIPFFLYDVALGDVVAWDPISRDLTMQVSSGRWVLRVAFEVGVERQQEWITALEEIGVRVERSSPRMIALDMPTQELTAIVAGMLVDGTARGELQYETGKL